MKTAVLVALIVVVGSMVVVFRMKFWNKNEGSDKSDLFPGDSEKER